MALSPERWEQVEQFYHAARARAAGERAAFLDAACAGDAALRREVESLLAQTASANGFLSGPAVAVAAQMISNPTGSILTGRKIGAYQIQTLLGAGGMGEVYRARDTKRGRDVAIKILPRIFTSDPERLARFERKARMLASLNHPHIGAIYGVEESDGVREGIGRNFDVSPDGSRFLMVKNLPTPTDAKRFIVVENWFGELERLAPTSGK
jgi:serine/threonine protein kinase